MSGAPENTLSVTRSAGSGRPVVLLHGLASRATQDWPAPVWEEAFAGRPLVRVDLPAHGESPAVGVLPTTGVVDLLAQAVAAVAPGEEVDLLGYSLGARLAWALAAHPALAVRRVALGGLSPMEPFTMVDLPAARLAATGGPAPADPITGMILGMTTLPATVRRRCSTSSRASPPSRSIPPSARRPSPCCCSAGSRIPWRRASTRSRRRCRTPGSSASRATTSRPCTPRSSAPPPPGSSSRTDPGSRLVDRALDTPVHYFLQL